MDWDQAIKTTGLPGGFRFHDLRHLGNLLAADAGASTRELMHRLGQSTMNAALIYQYGTAKCDREIAAGIDMRLARAMTADEPEYEDDDDDDSDADGFSGALVPAR